MDAKEFLSWNKRASPSQRADAASAVAKAFLYSDVTPEVRAGFETAMTVLLDDPSPMVRSALAEALANSREAPRPIILSLAGDQQEIAQIVLSRSPVFLDGELVDLVGAMDEPLQIAIAFRPVLSPSVSAALSELGSEAACEALLDNRGAAIARVSLDRLAQRFGHNAGIRNRLLARDDLPVSVRHNLVRDLGDVLSNLVQLREWMTPERAELTTREACDQATVAIAAESATDELGALAEHLRVSGQLTTSLLLRTLCAGNLSFFAAALSVLSRVPERRVKAIIEDRREAAFAAIYRRAGLPDRAYAAFATAVRICRHHKGDAVDSERRYRFTRRVIDEVLARYESISDGEMNELMSMLRRFAAEASRAAAREFLEIEVKAA